jgi:hypothetical protein
METINNDIFKVRVWNAKSGYYLPEFFLDEKGDVFVKAANRTGLYKFERQENFEKERCTGIADQFGKLIFQGDILGDGEEIAVVTWDEECYILEYPDGSIGEFALWCKRFAVIGTIHDEQFCDVAKLIYGEKE